MANPTFFINQCIALGLWLGFGMMRVIFYYKIGFIPRYRMQHKATLTNIKPNHLGFTRWLMDTGSLTRRLKSLSADFSVELLAQWQQIAKEDTEYWCAGEQIWNREVLLKLDGEAWVYALTQMPIKIGSNPIAHELQALGEKPLGELLFASGKLQRDPIKLLRCGASSRAWQLAKKMGQQPSEPLWGRCRGFVIDGSKLIVNEIFLPSAMSALTIQRDENYTTN